MFTGARPDPAFLTNSTPNARSHALAKASDTARSELLTLDPPTPIATDVISRWGHPIEEILRAADSLKAGLIVMAAKGHSNLRIILLGSVAQGVVQHATRPVLIARAPTKSVDRVILGYHGSAAGGEAGRGLGGAPVPPGGRWSARR